MVAGALARHLDPKRRGSHAGAGRPACDVDLRALCAAAPARRFVGWREGRALPQRLSALEPHMPGLPGLVLGSQVITPEDLESGWGLTGGHIFHAETTLDQSWIARPLLGWARHRAPVPKLYLASAGTHPGGGLTGASGWLAAQAVIEDLK